MIVNSESVGSE